MGERTMGDPGSRAKRYQGVQSVPCPWYSARLVTWTLGKLSGWFAGSSSSLLPVSNRVRHPQWLTAGIDVEHNNRKHEWLARSSHMKGDKLLWVCNKHVCLTHMLENGVKDEGTHPACAICVRQVMIAPRKMEGIKRVPTITDYIWLVSFSG